MKIKLLISALLLVIIMLGFTQLTNAESLGDWVYLAPKDELYPEKEEYHAQIKVDIDDTTYKNFTISDTFSMGCFDNEDDVRVFYLNIKPKEFLGLGDDPIDLKYRVDKNDVKTIQINRISEGEAVAATGDEAIQLLSEFYKTKEKLVVRIEGYNQATLTVPSIGFKEAIDWITGKCEETLQ